MRVLPSGDVTFLYTDIVSSTARFLEHGPAWAAVLAEHDRLVADAITRHGGAVVKWAGDGVIAAFGQPGAGVHAAVAVQRALASASWPPGLRPSVRMGLHRGDAVPEGDDYRSLHDPSAGAPHDAVTALEAALAALEEGTG